MSESEWRPCDHCEGSGAVIDYDAWDIRVGEQDPPQTTKRIECHFCLGKGEVRVTKPTETPYA